MMAKLVSSQSFRSAVVSIVFAGAASQSIAAASELSAMPAVKSQATCHDWAAEQNSDTIYAWGQQDTGQSSESIALSRLTGYCQGSPAPEVVRFGSSVGFDNRYCRHHRQAAICTQQ
jgi:hypothetical protein